MIANEKERVSNAGAPSQPRRVGMHDSRIRIGFVSAAAYGGMFVFGIVMALLGAILPSLSTRLQFQVADIGNLFLAMNFGMLVCCLLVGVALDRFGMKPALSVGPLLVAGALVLIVRAAAFRDLFPAVVLLGIGGGVLNAATNTTVADLHDDPRAKSSALNLLGVSYGFGALFLPFVIGAVVSNFGINRLVLAAAVLCSPPVCSRCRSHSRSRSSRNASRFAKCPDSCGCLWCGRWQCYCSSCLEWNSPSAATFPPISRAR